MRSTWKYLAAVIAAFLCAGFAAASERAIIEAIESGEIEVEAEVSLPPHSAAAPPLGGAAESSSHMLYAITAAEIDAITNKAFALMAAKWPFNVVFVCWENGAPDNLAQRTLVRDSVAQTWQKFSSLEFIGWNECSPQFTGVRIQIADEGPRVKYLGKYVAYDTDGNSQVIKNGMVLNFTFQNWSTSCQSQIDYCIKTISVHEFGHAIGFAHEQNRPDTPGECTRAPQGPDGDKLLTPWDKHSVMNYCNEKYSNDGELSEFDIKAVRYVYGQ